jgi:glycosyltransferase involved in cell wall biosynthesis
MSLATIDTETRALLEYAIPRGTDMDKMAMLQLMRSMDLNPLRREVYAIPYQGKLQIVIGVDGEARRIVEDAGAGLFVKPESAEDLARALRTLAADPARAARMGEQGRNYVEAHFSRAALARKYLGILGKVAGLTPPDGDVTPVTSSHEAAA